MRSMISCSEARSASVTRLISPLFVTLAVPRRCIKTLPASWAICIAKLSTGGPRSHFDCSRHTHLLRRDLEDVGNLLVPVSPGMIAGQLAKLVRDLFVEHQLGEVAIGSEYVWRIFSAAVEIEKGQRVDACGRQTVNDLGQIVCFTHLA